MKQKFQNIEDLLPHRPPFVFVDELIAVDEKRTVAKHRFRHDDDFFRGHFLDYPVVPGVLLVEMMAQCGGAGLRQREFLPANSFFVLATIEKAKFRRQVRPGDTVVIEVENVRISKMMLRQSGVVKVDDEIAVEATWMCIVGEQQKEQVK